MDRRSVPAARRRGTGRIYKQPGCSTWSLKYYRAGKCYRESTGLTDYQAARQVLNKKLGKIAEGVFTEPKLDRVRVGELMPAFFRQQRIDGCKDWERGKRRWERHLEPFFSSMLVPAVSTDVLNQYVDERLNRGAEAATVNRELAVLRGAFRLAAFSTPPRVQRLPKFPHLTERNVRTGFVEDAEYDRLVAQNPPLWLRAMLEMGYEYGWRRSELLNLQVRNVDLEKRAVALAVGTTKNDEGRLVKMTAAVYALLAQCVAGKTPSDLVFTTSDGVRVGDFRKRWRSLCVSVGLGRWVCPECGGDVAQDAQKRLSWLCSGCSLQWKHRELKYVGLIFHDLRRSGVRNMVRAGISEDVAMRVSGHKTREIFSRYNITSERDLEDAARKSEARRKTTPPAEFGHDNGHDSAEASPAARGRVN